MTTTVAHPTLRPATDGDAELLRALFVSCLPAGLSALGTVPGLLEQQHAARETSYAAAYACLRDQVVLVDGEPAGRLLTAPSDGATHVVDIAVAPAHRGRGLGTRLLEDLLAAGPVSLVVALDNPARGLYSRLGFRVVDETATHLLLRHPGLPTTEGTGA